MIQVLINTFRSNVRLNVFLLLLSLVIAPRVSFAADWHGPIKVHPVNHRTFVDRNGIPFFWLGDTNWAIFTRYTPSEVDQYLDARKRQGFTVVQTQLTYGALDNTRTERPAPNFAGDEPWVNGNPLRPNEAFFQNVDSIIAKARARDLVIALSPVWGLHYVTNNNLVTAANARQYGRWLAQRYRDAENIIWLAGGDTQVFGYANVYRELIAGLREGDNGVHLVAYHPGTYWPGAGGSTADPNYNPYGSNESGLDMHMVQTWQHYRDTLPLVWAANQTTPVKPVVNAEGAYEAGGSQRTTQLTYFDIPDVTPYIVRRQAYWSYFSGGFHTYGHWDIWTHNAGWENGLNAPGAAHMSVLRNVFDEVYWPELTPDNSLLPNSAGSNSRLALRAGDGSKFLVYLSEPTTLKLDLSRLQTGYAVSATWINPETGERSYGGQFPSNGTQEFTTPYGQDSLLLLQSVSNVYKASRDFSSLRQNERNWTYLDSRGVLMDRFDRSAYAWQGAEQYSLVSRDQMHPGNDSDAVRQWTAPFAGTARISGHAADADAGGGDGVIVSIRHGDDELWREAIANGDSEGKAFYIERSVKAGDTIRFIVNKNGHNGWDATIYDPTVELIPEGAGSSAEAPAASLLP